MTDINDYYRNKSIRNLGYVPEDDDPHIIDYPVSCIFAMDAIMRGYRVPERMIRYTDSEDRRQYLQWLRGERIEDNPEMAELKREIVKLREAIERRQPREVPRAPPVQRPQARQPEPAKPKPSIQGIAV